MRRVFTSVVFVVFCFLTVTILAQVPQLLNYQGRLTDDKGIPIITTTTVRFSLYQGGDAATAGSGTLCYQEDASVTPDDNGVFSHLIGSGTVIFGALDSTVFQTAEPVYLEITIDPAGANETLLPRKQIVTVGYSFKSELADDADTVDGQDASAFAPVVHNHDPDYVNEGQVDSVNSSMIVNDTIEDTDINAGANIAASKINRTGLDADLLDGVHSAGFVSTAGDDMTCTLTIDTSSQYGLSSTTSHTSGKGVYGYASDTAGFNYNYGVYGESKGRFGRGVFGAATAASGNTYGVYGESISPEGRGVYGYATATSGTTYGVYDRNASISGRGVYGHADAESGITYGVYGESRSPNGRGVYGNTTASSGENYGVYGVSSSTLGKGVYGYVTATSGTNYAICGKSISPNGHGVYGTAPTYGVHGVATATSGRNYGVYGTSLSSDGLGVYGYAAASTGTNFGVYGLSNSPYGHGVYGYASATSGTNYGVYGTTASSGNDSSGVYGYASATSGETYGVYGESISPEGRGVYGEATDLSGFNIGVYGKSKSTKGTGVFGHATSSTGVTYGVYGWSESSAGYAGYFYGKVHVTGNLTVSGNKPCVQPIDNGKKVLLYAMESPEIWFEDFGTAQLVNGQAVVQLESVFTQAANTEIAYFVFPIPNGECQGLYIARKDKDSFEVRELGDGTSNISFDYRIVAKRRGYEEVRFEEFTEPEQPSAEQKLPTETKADKIRQPQRP